MAAIMIDIDHFKKINDGYGHDAGDAVIKALACRLGDAFPPPHIVARFGGEEFCVLVTLSAGTERSGAKRPLAEALEAFRRGIGERPVQTGSGEIRFTVSVGACCAMKGGLEEMIKEADAMLYRSKNAGRDRVSMDGSCADAFLE